MKILIAAGFLLVLAACNTPVHPNASDDEKGRAAGCDTGRWRAGEWSRRYNKDEELYQTSLEYRNA